jgi:hypothetical protein
MTMLGIDTARWQAIGRQVALAWAIQSEARPRHAMHNTPMAPERLATLRTHWLARSDDEIDAAFALGPRPAPVPQPSTRETREGLLALAVGTGLQVLAALTPCPSGSPTCTTCGTPWPNPTAKAAR